MSKFLLNKNILMKRNLIDDYNKKIEGEYYDIENMLKQFRNQYNKEKRDLQSLRDILLIQEKIDDEEQQKYHQQKQAFSINSKNLEKFQKFDSVYYKSLNQRINKIKENITIKKKELIDIFLNLKNTDEKEKIMKDYITKKKEIYELNNELNKYIKNLNYPKYYLKKIPIKTKKKIPIKTKKRRTIKKKRTKKKLKT